MLKLSISNLIFVVTGKVFKQCQTNHNNKLVSHILCCFLHCYYVLSVSSEDYVTSEHQIHSSQQQYPSVMTGHSQLPTLLPPLSQVFQAPFHQLQYQQAYSTTWPQPGYASMQTGSCVHLPPLQQQQLHQPQQQQQFNLGV